MVPKGAFEAASAQLEAGVPAEEVIEKAEQQARHQLEEPKQVRKRQDPRRPNRGLRLRPLEPFRRLQPQLRQPVTNAPEPRERPLPQRSPKKQTVPLPHPLQSPHLPQQSKPDPPGMRQATKLL